jgi:hypothetical protein
VEIADVNRVYAQPPAQRVTGPRSEGCGEERDQQVGAAAAAQEDEQGGMETADEKGEYWRGAD